MNDKIFTVEYDMEQECIEIHLNPQGVAELINILSRCAQSSVDEHIHLFTPSWGGVGLTEEKQNMSDQSKLINHLKIMYWKE